MRALRTLKWIVLTILILFVAVGYWALSSLRLGLNGTDSLPYNGFLFMTWPIVYWHGVLIATEPPAIVADRFDGFVFVKMVYGLPGDAVVHNEGGDVCIRGACFPMFETAGVAFGAPLEPGIIPEGMVAAFGTSADSLDSRYAKVGLFPKSEVSAVGVPLDMPHWTELKVWLDQQ